MRNDSVKYRQLKLWIDEPFEKVRELRLFDGCYYLNVYSQRMIIVHL